MLKRMKRLYSINDYKDMLARARATIPDVSISSDFIVGFCGETEEQFATCGELIRHGRFKNSYIFKYSPRPGTKAHQLFEDDIPEDTKRRRNNDLLSVQAEISLADHRQRIGEIAEVLVEGPSKAALKEDETAGLTQLTGRTMTDHIVVFDAHTRLIGQTVKVRIDNASSWTLFGTVETREGVAGSCADAVLSPPLRVGEVSDRRINLNLI
jgi:tRNA-2-methylthio-N6-dimethylallyladenosine synthase